MARKLEFKGQDVDEAINKACAKMRLPREELDIEIQATGTSGIFGLCRKKAVILVARKKKETSLPPAEEQTSAEAASAAPEEQQKPLDAPPIAHQKKDSGKKISPKRPAPPQEQVAPLTAEILGQIKNDLEHLLKLMDLSSEVSIEESNNKAIVQISGDHIDALTANDGQTLDSLQYLIRKIIGKKFPQKIPLSIDAGNFREKRKTELQELALKLAAEVKKTEKTRTIPPLNPAERRIVHLVLQEDKTIRSRSVGEGLFKKILIYLPGKGRSRKKQPRRRGRKN